MLVACCLELVARIRAHAVTNVASVGIANGLIRFIPRDSVKFWMSKFVCHASVYHILYSLPADPNKRDSCRIHYCCQGLDMF